MKEKALIKDLDLLERLINDLEKYVNERLHENLRKMDDKLWIEIREIRESKKTIN